jgi:hypothetical protein
VRALVVDPGSPSTIYSAADGHGLFKSIDGGMTWTATATGPAFFLPAALAIDPTNPTRVYAGLRGDGIDASVAKIARNR